MTQVYDSKEFCCGCTACFSICPKNAITMQPDECGFLYPVINVDICIDCGLCRKVCQFKEPKLDVDKDPICYAVKHKDENVRRNSRSGGAFTALSDIILNKGMGGQSTEQPLMNVL